jgi:hypothetical protein
MSQTGRNNMGPQSASLVHESTLNHLLLLPLAPPAWSADVPPVPVSPQV